MLTIQPADQGDHVKIVIKGAVEESADFFKVLNVPAKRAVFECSGVERVNSVGVKIWVKYFSLLQSRGLAFEFENMPPVLIDLLNTIRNFCGGGKVKSVLLPFRCTGCKTHLLCPATLDQCRQIKAKVPDTKCPKCSGKAEFDDLPDTFFEFLSRVS